jgi:hypothetical protein
MNYIVSLFLIFNELLTPAVPNLFINRAKFLNKIALRAKKGQ